MSFEVKHISVNYVFRITITFDLFISESRTVKYSIDQAIRALHEGSGTTSRQPMSSAGHAIPSHLDIHISYMRYVLHR